MQYDWAHTSALYATMINVNRYSGPPIPIDCLVPQKEEAKNQKDGREIITDPEIKKAVWKKVLEQNHGN